jgi:hypothetical protein
LIEAKKQGRQPKVWGVSTAHNARTAAFRVFSWAKDEGLLPDNPLAGMKRPKPPPRQRAMSDDEFRKLHDNAGGSFRDLRLALRETAVANGEWGMKDKPFPIPHSPFLQESVRACLSFPIPHSPIGRFPAA